MQLAHAVLCDSSARGGTAREDSPQHLSRSSELGHRPVGSCYQQGGEWLGKTLAAIGCQAHDRPAHAWMFLKILSLVHQLSRARKRKSCGRSQASATRLRTCHSCGKFLGGFDVVVPLLQDPRCPALEGDSFALALGALGVSGLSLSNQISSKTEQNGITAGHPHIIACRMTSQGSQADTSSTQQSEPPGTSGRRSLRGSSSRSSPQICTTAEAPRGQAVRRLLQICTRPRCPPPLRPPLWQSWCGTFPRKTSPGTEHGLLQS